MFRVLTRLGPISVSSLMPLKWLSDPDKVDPDLIKDFNRYDPNLTGKERLIKMFKRDEFDGFSDEFNFICQSMVMAGIVGVFYGGCRSGFNAQKKHLERNQASTYFNAMEGKRAYQDEITKEFIRGSYRVGWRLVLVTGIYTSISKTIQVYRGEPSIIEYVVGGSLTGLLYKINMGLKGAVVGTVLGTVMGFICGGLTLMVLKVTDVSMGDVHLWQHQYRQKRLAAMKKTGTNTEEEENPLQVAHDATVEKEGRKDEIFVEK